MEQETEVSSNSLFHYTGCFENLKGIIRDGIKPKYCLEEFPFFNNTNDKLEEFISELAFPISCFCDIPVELSNYHRRVYGDYAIALSKDWGRKHFITPVWYYTNEFAENFMKPMIRNSFKIQSFIDKRSKQYNSNELEFSYENQVYDGDLERSKELMKQLRFYIKPYIGPYKREKTNFEEENYKFYDEREWRYYPYPNISRSFLSKQDFEDQIMLNQYNTSLDPLMFELDEIKRIYVRTNSEMDLINNELKRKFGVEHDGIVEIW